MISPTFVVLGGQKVSKFKSLLLMFGTLILLSGCSNVEVFNAKGPVASSQVLDYLFNHLHACYCCCCTYHVRYFIFKYSYNKTAKLVRCTNSLIETIWFVVPIIIVIALSIPTVKTLYDYEKPPE